MVETAKHLIPLGVDVLKAEFPLDITETDQKVWAEACAEISAASIVPWILLSAAVDHEVFLQQVVIACHAGASGIAYSFCDGEERAYLKDITKVIGQQIPVIEDHPYRSNGKRVVSQSYQPQQRFTKKPERSERVWTKRMPEKLKAAL